MSFIPPHDPAYQTEQLMVRWHTSVWGTVPLLCLHEKGYSEDEYVTRQVDISE